MNKALYYVHEGQPTDDFDIDSPRDSSQTVLQGDGIGTGVGACALEQLQVSAVHLHRHREPVAGLTLHRVLLPNHLGCRDRPVGDVQVQLLSLDHDHVLRLQIHGWSALGTEDRVVIYLGLIISDYTIFEFLNLNSVDAYSRDPW